MPAILVSLCNFPDYELFCITKNCYILFICLKKIASTQGVPQEMDAKFRFAIHQMKTKSDLNTVRTISKKFIGGLCPRTPLANRKAKFQNLKKIILAPPPCQILATPLSIT